VTVCKDWSRTKASTPARRASIVVRRASIGVRRASIALNCTLESREDAMDWAKVNPQDAMDWAKVNPQMMNVPRCLLSDSFARAGRIRGILLFGD